MVLYLQSKDKEPNQDQDAKSWSITSSIPQSPKSGFNRRECSAKSKSRYIAEIQVMGVIKTIDQMEIKIKMLNPSEEPKHPQKPHAVLEIYGCSLLLQKQDRKPKFETFVHQSR